MRTILKKVTVFLTTLALAGPLGLGQTSTPTIDRIEEDWEVVIASPSPVDAGPQITTCMSPVADGSTPFVAFDLNYIDYPSFQAGGLQAKVYSNTDGSVLDSSSQGNALLQTTNETITWTQRMSVVGNSVLYTIDNGHSTTWGALGTLQGLLPLTFTASASSLASYSPDWSVANSGVGWQSNRVTSMTLVQVRYYSGDQLVSTDTNARAVSLPIGQ